MPCSFRISALLLAVAIISVPPVAGRKGGVGVGAARGSLSLPLQEAGVRSLHIQAKEFLAPEGENVAEMLGSLGRARNLASVPDRREEAIGVSSSSHADALVISHRHQHPAPGTVATSPIASKELTEERSLALERQIDNVENNSTGQLPPQQEAMSPHHAPQNTTSHHLPGFFNSFTGHFQPKEDGHEDAAEEEEEQEEEEEEEEGEGQGEEEEEEDRQGEQEEDEGAEDDPDAAFQDTGNETAVQQEAPGIKAILVGNGKSLLKRKVGRYIDQFDVVGRFNYFQLKGHEGQVGTKTTLWFLGELKHPKAKEFDRSVKPDKYIVPVTWPVEKGCRKCMMPKSAKKGVAQTRGKVIAKYKGQGLAGKLEIMNNKVQLALRSKYNYHQRWPSTGIIAIVYMLQRYKAPIYITGYDFGSAKKKDCSWNGCTSPVLGHWFQKNYKSSTVHNMYEEGMFIKRLIKRGMVKVL